MRLVLAGFVLVAACGVEPAKAIDTGTDPVAVSTYHRNGVASLYTLNCDSQPTDNGNGTSTTAACPFEQQQRNIEANGTPASASRLLANGVAVAFQPSSSCNQWLMGTDATGATVFISTSNGDVLSHGAVHPGYPLSVLPSPLALPLTLSP